MRVSELKRRIRQVEGFRVNIESRGKRVHGNTRIESYDYKRMAPHDMTAYQFIHSARVPKKFKTIILDVDGVPASSKNKLRVIREQYKRKHKA